ncbi:acetylglutamate kinase [Niveibacterium umoris]|uniref:Acetylglutamate kinase n=1 Tax=Niveibacterium umoris TaxID=1193620 RepID=A0A840BJ51_9RHOO|nr:acetylglutamate kinase [Niveibacterium umoris]MBB4011622.1 acetylglutamate kinase [Niveibacterium umoris]
MPTAALSPRQRAAILGEALPYIRSLHGKTLVIKIGGQAVADPSLKAGFARDVALLQLVGIRLVVVHGGGPNIPAFLRRLGLADTGGATDGSGATQTRDYVEMVLGELNQEIVALINRNGGKAVGLSGLDGPLIRGVMHADGSPETGQVVFGEVAGIDAEIIRLLQTRNFVPVIMPIAAGNDGAATFVDADAAAARIAEAMHAEKLLVMADSPGLTDANGHVQSSLGIAAAEALLASTGGLAADLRARLAPVVDALKGGIGSAKLLDARVPNALLLEVLGSEGIGSLIRSRRGPDFGADTLRYFGGT